VAIALGLSVIVTVGTYLLVRSRMRAERLAVFERQAEVAARDEASGQFETALASLDRALETAESVPRLAPGRLASLREDRERLAGRIERERHEGLIRTAGEALEAVDALLATTPVDAAQALALATSAFSSAREVADPRAEALQRQAREAVASLVRERGVVFVPVSGSFLLDAEVAPAEYSRRLRPILTRVLALRGYLPEPKDSPLADLWASEAPYRLAISAAESFSLNYLQSSNRTSRSEVSLALERDGRTLWTSRVVAKTRVPSPAFSAFEAGYMGTARKREEKIERKLYVDTLDDLEVEVPGRLGNLPAWPGREG
jgi:hypothetical protein